MKGDAKGGKCSFKVLFLTSLLIQALMALTMITSLLTNAWVYFEFDSTNPEFAISDSEAFNSQSFKGSLVGCHKGCSNSYATEYKAWCSFSNETTSNIPITNISSVPEAHSLCQMFTGLYSGMISYLVFELLSLLGLSIWFSMLVLLLNGKRILCLTYFISIFSFISHFFAILLWAEFTGAGFLSCSVFPSNGSKPVLCIDAGPRLAMFTLVIFFVFLGIYLILARILYTRHIRHMNSRISIKSEPAETPLRRGSLNSADLSLDHNFSSDFNVSMKKRRSEIGSGELSPTHIENQKVNTPLEIDLKE